jgi:L-ascorbate metabolism protein UlaG (beta-lactamase superfamily)
MKLSITHIGTSTMLLEIGALRLLTDPVFDPAGGRYCFGWGTGSTKLSGPTIAPDHVGPLDAVLLSHDHHEDNPKQVIEQEQNHLMPTGWHR